MADAVGSPVPAEVQPVELALAVTVPPAEDQAELDVSWGSAVSDGVGGSLESLVLVGAGLADVAGSAEAGQLAPASRLGEAVLALVPDELVYDQEAETGQVGPVRAWHAEGGAAPVAIPQRKAAAPAVEELGLQLAS